MESRVSLSDDMLINILLYLSVKSLLRFRSVSRYWCLLIKSPNFLAKHLKYDSKKRLLLKRHLSPENIQEHLWGGDDVLSFHNPDCLDLLVSPNLLVPFLDDTYGRYQMNLFGPCNGIVCLQLRGINILCNPALQEFKLIDPTPFAFPECHGAYESGSGFGFDANNNDYKVIQMWRIVDNRDDYVEDRYIRIDVYNLSTSSWQLIDVIVPDVFFDPGFELFFNGACHWHAREFLEGPPAMGTILSFDVSTEVFRKFQFPDDSLNDERYPGLVILNQCLALVRYARWMDELHLIDIWIMKEYGVTESWTKELTIGPCLFKRHLVCWRNKLLIVEAKDSQLAYYAIHDNDVRKLPYYGFHDSFRALIFAESLVSLNQVNCITKTT